MAEELLTRVKAVEQPAKEKPQPAPSTPAPALSSGDAVEKFEAFIDQQVPPAQRRKLTEKERSALYQKYKAWLESQNQR